MNEDINIYPPLEGNVLMYSTQKFVNERDAQLPVHEEIKTDVEKKIDNTLVGKIIEVMRTSIDNKWYFMRNRPRRKTINSG